MFRRLLVIGLGAFLGLAGLSTSSLREATANAGYPSTLK